MDARIVCRRNSLFISSAALLLVACQSNGSPSTVQPAMRLRFETKDGTFLGAFPAEIKAVLGPVPTYDFGFAVRGPGGDALNATAVLPSDQILSGHVSVVASSGGNGTARIERSGSKALVAENGTLDLSFASGRITGSVTVSPDVLSGNVSGDIAVGCWVPASELGSQPGVAGGIMDQNALVLDEHMETPSCAPLRGLAKP